MSDTEDMVYFLTPDGTKVSNDRRFDLDKARQEMLDSTPNRGDAGITRAEQEAQVIAVREANLQSGQPGVGSNAVPENPEDLVPKTGSGLQVQRDDRKEAQEAGATPGSPAVETSQPEDSNEKVAEVRKAEQRRQEAALKAMQDLGDDGAGDPDKPYSEWSGKQLKAEVLRRNAERGEDDQISTKGVRKSSQLIELLETDDAEHTGD